MIRYTVRLSALIGLVLGLPACLTIAGIALAGPNGQRISTFRHDGSGVFPDAMPPLHWRATTNAPVNALWRVPLPGSAECSQPILGGDRIYVQSVPFALTCIDAASGKVLWQKERHADDKAANDSEEENASRLERHVIFCEREIIGRFGSMNAVKPGRPLSMEERYSDGIWFRSPGGSADAAKVEPELAAIRARIPETWPDSNAQSAVADNYGYRSYTAIASPTTDGQAVFALFATGVVVAYDRDGKRRWLRLLTTPEGNLPKTGCYTAVTPLSFQGRLYVPRFATAPGHEKRESELHCLDAATGATLWVKPMGNLGYHGPLALARDGNWFIVTPAGVAFRPDGTRLPGTFGGMWYDGGNAGPSPALDHARGILALDMGVRLPAAGKDEPEVLWRFEHRHGVSDEKWLAQHVPVGEKPIPLSQRGQWDANIAAAAKLMRKSAQPEKRGGVRNFCSPLLHEGLLYHCQSTFKVLSVSDMRDGKLENMFYAEPVPFSEVKAQPRGVKHEVPFLYTDLAFAGGYIFIHGWTETVIVKAGTEFEVVAVNEHDPSMSNLLFDGDRLYLRDLRHLWCLGGPDGRNAGPVAPRVIAPPTRKDYPDLARRLVERGERSLLPILWTLDSTATAALVNRKLADGREEDNKNLLQEMSAIEGDRTAVLPAVANILKTGKDPWYRATAAATMESMGPSALSAVPDLVAALGDKEECVRRYAARALGAIGPRAKDAIPALEKLLPDPVPAEESPLAMEKLMPDPAEEIPLLCEVRHALASIRGEKK